MLIATYRAQASNAAAVTFLLRASNGDGGWGYAADQLSTLEATAAAALALRDEPPAARAYSEALHCLRAAQHRDGGWGFNAEDPESGWETAWAVLALANAPGEPDTARRGAAWLLEVKFPASDDEMVAEGRKMLAIDTSLRGWPWLPGQAAWVEPTALSLLALNALPTIDTPANRLDEAVRYLSDRRCGNGGWNFGNPVMLGAGLPPRAHPTAWALLALARLKPDAIRAEDMTALRAEMARDGGALALGLGLLALRTLGEDDGSSAARLALWQLPDGSWNGNPYHTAVALLAARGSL